MKYFFQENRYDCGAACVATILSYFDVKEELSTIAQKGSVAKFSKKSILV